MSTMRMQAPCSSRPYLPRRSRHHVCRVVAWKATACELKEMALTSFPSAFQHSSHARIDPATAARLSPAMRYYFPAYTPQDMASTSAPARTLSGQEYHQHLADIHSAYGPAYMQPLRDTAVMAADDATGDVFMLFTTRVQNTGPHAGRQPSLASSVAHGVYRLHFDDEGRVDSAWCFRGPTQEERSYLLKSQVSEAAWPRVLSLHPCTWQPDATYHAHIKDAANAWAHKVLGKSCLATLSQVAHPELHYYEGAAIHSSDPMTTVEAVAGDLLVRNHKFELGAVDVHSLVAEENKVFLHWSQPVTCRKSREVAHAEGTFLFVFDEAGKVVQVLDYHTPCKHERAQLFKQGVPEHVLAAPAAPRVGNTLTAEEMQAIALQEQHWESGW